MTLRSHSNPRSSLPSRSLEPPHLQHAGIWSPQLPTRNAAIIPTWSSPQALRFYRSFNFSETLSPRTARVSYKVWINFSLQWGNGRVLIFVVRLWNYGTNVLYFVYGRVRKFYSQLGNTTQYSTTNRHTEHTSSRYRRPYRVALVFTYSREQRRSLRMARRCWNM
jgi:hypothetical protein